MRIKVTLLLLMLNALLFGALFYLHHLERSPDYWQEENRLVFPLGFIENADRLRLRSGDGELVWDLRRYQSGWKIEAPVEWNANGFAVSRMLNHLQLLEWNARFDTDELTKSGEDLGSYGLDSPMASLEIVAGAETQVLVFGASAKSGGRLYLHKQDSSQIYVVNDDLLDVTVLDVSAMRSTEVFDIPLFELRSVRIQNAEGLATRLIKKSHDWFLETPIRAHADKARLEKALVGLLALPASNFQSRDDMNLPWDSPSLRIDLEGNNRRQALLVIRSDDGAGMSRYYARLEGTHTVFQVPYDTLKSFEIAQEVFRDRHIFTMPWEGLSEIALSMSGDDLSLQVLESGRWSVIKRQPDDALVSWEADDTVMDSFITFLKELETMTFVNDAPSAYNLERYGLDSPAKTIRLKIGGQVTSLLIGGLAEDGSFYAKFEDKPFVYAVPSSLMVKTPLNALHYRSRRVYAMTEAVSLKKIILKSLLMKDAPALEVHSNDSEWQKLVLEAMDFRVKQYTDSEFNDSFIRGMSDHKWAYQLSFYYDMPTASGMREEVYNFWISEELAGEFIYGGSDRFGINFIFPPSLVKTFRSLFDRYAALNP